MKSVSIKIVASLSLGFLCFCVWGKPSLNNTAIGINLPLGNPETVLLRTLTESNYYYIIERNDGLHEPARWRAIDALQGDGTIKTISYRPFKPKAQGYFRVRVSETPPDYFARLQDARDHRPIFKPSLTAAERSNTVATIDSSFQLMMTETNLPLEVQQGVQVWERLSQQEKLLLLDPREHAVAFVPALVASFAFAADVATVVIAAVELGKLAYAGGKAATWWGAALTVLNNRPFESDELDALINDYVPPRLNLIGAADLDFK